MSGTGGLNRSASRRLLGAERTIAVRYSGSPRPPSARYARLSGRCPDVPARHRVDRSKAPAMVRTLPGDFSSHKIKAGLAADVGIEGRLVGRTAKVEYLDLGKHHPDLSGKFNDRGRVQFPITDNSVCVGINYKFDP